MRFASRARARGASVLVADFGRAYLSRDRLTPLAAYDVPGQRATEDADIKHTTVWTLAERPGQTARPATPVRTRRQLTRWLDLRVDHIIADRCTPDLGCSDPRSLAP